MKRLTSLILVLVLLISGCGQSLAAQWQEQYDLGMRYLSEGNYQEAILAFTAAIEIDSNRAEAYVGRGDAYVASGETEENLAAAQADYERAIELDPTIPEAWLGLADVYIRRGDYDQALEILQEGLEQTGNNSAIADKIAEIESGNITDSSQQVRRRTGYDENGTRIWYHDYLYGPDGKRTQVNAYNAAGDSTGSLTLSYDESGNILEDFSFYWSDGRIFRLSKSYERTGQLARTEEYSVDGELDEIWEYKYQEDGQRSKWLFYEPNGTLIRYYDYLYDASGQLEERVFRDGDGSLISREMYSYDSEGNNTEIAGYNAQGILEYRHVYIYDSEGNSIRMDEYDGDGNLISSQATE